MELCVLNITKSLCSHFYRVYWAHVWPGSASTWDAVGRTGFTVPKSTAGIASFRLNTRQTLSRITPYNACSCTPPSLLGCQAFEGGIRGSGGLGGARARTCRTLGIRCLNFFYLAPVVILYIWQNIWQRFRVWHGVLGGWWVVRCRNLLRRTRKVVKRAPLPRHRCGDDGLWLVRLRPVSLRPQQLHQFLPIRSTDLLAMTISTTTTWGPANLRMARMRDVCCCKVLYKLLAYHVLVL